QQRDMPFLVDSIRVELNRRNIAIHSIKSTVLDVQRDARHRLEKLLPQRSSGVEEPSEQMPPENICREALIYMEISLHTNGKDLRGIARDLREVLRNVDVVVSDYRPLVDMAETVEENLQRVTREPLVQRVNESRAFLRWLRSDHFTFLGYAEYDLIEREGMQELHENPNRRLGLFRLGSSKADIKQLDDSKPGIAQFYLSPKLIAFSKSATRANVHRHAYSDYVVVKRF